MEAIGNRRIEMLALAHMLLWLTGLGGIVLETKRLRRSEWDRMQAEQAVRESEEKHRTFLESLQGIAYQADY